MSIERVKALLAELQTELQKSDKDIDKQTKQQLIAMDNNIQNILSRDNQQEQDIYDSIEKMEYDFIGNHPMASNIMREIINLLSKAGI